MSEYRQRRPDILLRIRLKRMTLELEEVQKTAPKPQIVVAANQLNKPRPRFFHPAEEDSVASSKRRCGLVLGPTTVDQMARGYGETKSSFTFPPEAIDHYDQSNLKGPALLAKRQNKRVN